MKYRNSILLFLLSMLNISALAYNDETTKNDPKSPPTCKDKYFAEQGYQCVPYYQCEEGEIVTDGLGLIDVRGTFAVSLEPEKSKCPGYFEICCRHPDFIHLIANPWNRTTTTTTKKPTFAPIVEENYQSKCGQRNTNGLGARIKTLKNKQDTQFGEWPNMCAILERETTTNGDRINVYRCGGSLVAPNIILTAAHCVDKINENDLIVRCGEWDTRSVVEPMKHQERHVEHKIINPLYKRHSLFNDLALLYLDKAFELDHHIDVACLPDSKKNFVRHGTKGCVAAGWGKDRFGDKGKYQVVLRQVSLDQVSNKECEKSLQNTRLGFNFQLDDSFTCASGKNGEDTCSGDGGGPLMCPVQYGNGNIKNYVQVGIVAWGIGCGQNGVPGVYADVEKGMCFMKLAHHCYNSRSLVGAANPFVAYNCQNWFQGQIARLEKRIDNRKNLFNGKLNRIKKLKARARIIEAENDLKKLLDFKKDCSSWQTFPNEE